MSIFEMEGMEVPEPIRRATYYEAPAEYHGESDAVFLAGGITGCPDWQADVRHMLDGLPVAILNPRRGNFPIHDPSAASAQIDWEYRHLLLADVVLFWFPASGDITQPIALYELGAHAARGSRIAVGADPGYVRRADVVLQLGHVRPGVRVRDNLADVCADAVELLEGSGATAVGEDVPRTWAMPDEPSPEVAAVKDRDGDMWRRDGKWWEFITSGPGRARGTRLGWRSLFETYRPLIDATAEFDRLPGIRREGGDGG